jgi:hypothetical protein
LFDITKVYHFGIADTQTASIKAGNDDITNFFAPSKFQLCWSYQQNRHVALFPHNTALR